MVNIIFALILYFGLMTTNNNFISNKIDSLVDGYNAQVSGLQSNDEIISVNGKRVINGEDINEQLFKSNGEKVKVLIKRNGEKIEYEITPNEVKYKETGIYLKEGTSTKIVALQEESSAQKQGLEVNDVILKVNGEDVKRCNTNKQIIWIYKIWFMEWIKKSKRNSGTYEDFELSKRVGKKSIRWRWRR